MAEIFDLEDIKRKMLRKYPFFGATISNVKYEIVGSDHPVTKAATDGETIFANAEFLSGLTEDEQVFIFAHEVCHIALKHIQRSKERDPQLWNIATDGVINQHLKKDGLTMPNGAVDIEGATEYDAEELYNILLEAKQKEKEQNGRGQGQSDSQDDRSQEKQAQNGADSEEVNNVGHDDHSMWQEAVKREEQENERKEQENNNKTNEISEKQIFEKNDEEKIRRAEEVMQKINSTRRGLGGNSQVVNIGEVGRADKSVANWRKILIRALEIEEEVWGHRFSDRSNGYAARIEDAVFDEDMETEIILDTSGSVSVELLKNFLRQVKILLKNSNIKVGTFSDKFHGFVEIKKEAEIDSLKIKVGGGTNFNAASEAFSKCKDVNKICFTDGEDNGNANINNKRNDILWISYENPNFKPDNGKVIYVSKDKINHFEQEEPERT